MALTLSKLVLIAFGGGAGAVFRYLLAGWVQGPRITGAIVFPVGTLVVNVLGSLLIGVLAAAFLTGPYMLREEFRAALFVGLLGGFTTFSTFSFETLELINDAQWGRATANILLTNALCLGGVWIGFRLMQWALASP